MPPSQRQVKVLLQAVKDSSTNRLRALTSVVFMAGCFVNKFSLIPYKFMMAAALTGCRLSMRYLLSALLVLLTLTACQNTSTPPGEEGNIYNTTDEDKEMNEAILTARNTLHQLDTVLASGNYDEESASLKVKFDAPGGGEHMWVGFVMKKDGVYSGIVANEAELTKEVKMGDSIAIDPANITDWKYSDNGVLRGGYTIRLIRKRMTKEERTQLDKELPYKVED